MDPQDFALEAPGAVRTVLAGHLRYSAFLPDPLPPKLTWDGELVALLAEAGHALGTLAGLGQNLENPHLLITPFLDREAVLSSQIEGTQTTYRDLALFKAKDEGTAPTSDLREVNNYVRALDHGLARLPDLPVSIRLLRELHAILLEGVRGHEHAPGELRRAQNWIGPPGCNLREATFVPPPAEDLLEHLGALERYMHGSNGLPALVRLALIHYQFETIHPFLDGNGRLGRLLIVLLLCEWRLLPAPLLYLSAFFHQHRQDYYERLQRVRTHGEWTEWLAFFLRGVRSQAEDAVARSTRLIATRRRFYALVQEQKGAGTLFRLIDALFAHPFVTIPLAQRVLGFTHRAAKLNVEKLVGAGILAETARQGRRRVFVCAEVLAALE